MKSFKSAWLISGLAGAIVFLPQTALGQEIQVQKGDTLYSLSKKHQISVADLKSLNHLSTNSLYVGQTLKTQSVTVKTSSSAATVSAAAVSSTYKVAKGDTLFKISQKFNLSVTQLKTWNNLTQNTVYVGQLLKVSAPVAPTPPAATPLHTPASPSSVTSNALQAKKIDQLIATAKTFQGVPYLWGGNTPKGFDCSGYLKYVFHLQGKSIPRTVSQIWAIAEKTDILEKGDLVFFETYAPGPSHAGIYLGNNEFIHASSSKGITINKLSDSYWKVRYLGFKRISF